MGKENFFKLDSEEQRAVLASAISTADKEQTEKLKENHDRVMVAKYELIALINEILGTEYTAKDKVIFTQTDNGVEVTTE